MAKVDVHKFDQNLRHERDFVAIYRKEKERLQKEAK